jgi:hypothetical protein
MDIFLQKPIKTSFRKANIQDIHGESYIQDIHGKFYLKITHIFLFSNTFVYWRGGGVPD